MLIVFSSMKMKMGQKDNRLQKPWGVKLAAQFIFINISFKDERFPRFSFYRRVKIGGKINVSNTIVISDIHRTWIRSLSSDEHAIQTKFHYGSFCRYQQLEMVCRRDGRRRVFVTGRGGARPKIYRAGHPPWFVDSLKIDCQQLTVIVARTIAG